MIINSMNLRGIFTSFNTLFNKAFTETPVQYDRVAMVVPSTSRETTYGWLGQIPNMREWVGERVIQNLMAYSYTIKNKDFELTVKIPANDIADDQLGIYNPIVSEMGLAAKTHPDELIFNLLGNGFTNNGYDEVPFFSDNHPWIKTKKQSNKGTKKLSAATYAEARSQMMTIKGENGKSLKIVPDLLVVSPQNEAKAREILFADLISGSTNVNKNTCELLVVPELADYAEQWYLLCTKRYIRPLVFQEREKPVLVAKNKDTDDNVFFENEYLYGIKARYNAGYGLWQLAFGSTGEIV
jgi:phage major head subunit gpT-like protein